MRAALPLFLPSTVYCLLLNKPAAAHGVVEVVFVGVAGELDGARPGDVGGDAAVLVLHADVGVLGQGVLFTGGAQLLRDPVVALDRRVGGLVHRLLHEVFVEVGVVRDRRVVVGGVGGERDDDDDGNEVEARAAALASPPSAHLFHNTHLTFPLVHFGGR